MLSRTPSRVLASSVRVPLAQLPISNGLFPGLAGVVKTLANEHGPVGVRINGLLPVRIATDRVREFDALSGDPDEVRTRESEHIPLRRYGEPQEFGQVAAFLLSPAASYITGAMIPVDGGAIRSTRRYGRPGANRWRIRLKTGLAMAAGRCKECRCVVGSGPRTSPPNRRSTRACLGISSVVSVSPETTRSARSCGRSAAIYTSSRAVREQPLGELPPTRRTRDGNLCLTAGGSSPLAPRRGLRTPRKWGQEIHGGV
jgi:hypothetical protein